MAVTTDWVELTATEVTAGLGLVCGLWPEGEGCEDAPIYYRAGTIEAVWVFLHTVAETLPEVGTDVSTGTIETDLLPSSTEFTPDPGVDDLLA